MKHEQEIVMKLAKKEMKKVDAYASLDKGKTEGAYYLMNVALDIIREVGVEKIEKLIK
jgi:phage terminase large subunit-like protein